MTYFCRAWLCGAVFVIVARIASVWLLGGGWDENLRRTPAWHIAVGVIGDLLFWPFFILWYAERIYAMHKAARLAERLRAALESDSHERPGE